MHFSSHALDIVKKLTRAGHTAYFAGGWVRDYLMGSPSADVDIATSATPAQILDLFPRTLLVGLAFGVVIVLVDGERFEVSSFRKDLSYVNGRRPEQIAFSCPKEDALRRDFTINGMFYDPLEDKIYDFVQGTEDLKKGIIRAIGDPQQRFSEDRLRMIRAIRFSSRFGFLIDPDTHQGIIDNASTLFPAVARERVWQEFNKMAAYPGFDHAIIEMHRAGLLSVVFPSLTDAHLREIKKRVALLRSFPAGAPTIAFLLELFPQATEEEVKELISSLRASRLDAQIGLTLLMGRRLIKREEDPSLTDVEWVAFYAQPFSPLSLEIEALRQKEEKQNFLERHRLRQIRLAKPIQRAKDKKPLMTGEDLTALGIAPGKNMGFLLQEAERIAIIKNIETKEEALKQLKLSPHWPLSLP